ncbi:MAG: Metal-dependent hydrolases of the beta-lactamase superfamily I [uncultured Thiotrichaceae bacterium]|uniref:Metal-dependent hydrolases of the beta-lactamase superfamily I n=1 Tax=uncultured Thiotrichaceae bacterium TaxID=298394 RepID=A0A6S6U0H8_9GAMM|nr:MAG: Metal-dependent hydrolases of the beta-lactamase superfamily I [uncultured Thiotrichaceae bacterium]
MLRFASLGSGSKGNGTLVEANSTRVLIDCGFGLAETERRLATLNCEPQSIAAILITHEHGDHAGGVGKLSRKYKIPVWSTVGTYTACKDDRFASFHVICSERSFAIKDVHINPFPVPHDAREPCQFTFSDGNSTMGLLTDVGDYTPHILNKISGVDALMLECNYDWGMLDAGKYPQSLKRRVSGRYGHLDNRQSQKILEFIDTSKLQYLIGMHLSENNNHEELAMEALCAGMKCKDERIFLANQESGFFWKKIQ